MRFLFWLLERWNAEPVVIIELIKAAFVVAAAWGFELTAEQAASVVGFMVASSVLTRSRVRPVNKSVPNA
ncbi:MAG: hypothetical protein ACYC2H_01240 [Thermoplasmatota archaeon]